MIQIKKVGTSALQDLLEEVVAKTKEGYIFHPQRKIGRLATRTSAYGYVAYMFKPEEVEIEPKREVKNEMPSITDVVEKSLQDVQTNSTTDDVSTQDLLAELDQVTKKDDLLVFAEKVGVVVPDDMKYPKQISAHIRKELEGDKKNEA